MAVEHNRKGSGCGSTFERKIPKHKHTERAAGHAVHTKLPVTKIPVYDGACFRNRALGETEPNFEFVDAPLLKRSFFLALHLGSFGYSPRISVHTAIVAPPPLPRPHTHPTKTVRAVRAF